MADGARLPKKVRLSGGDVVFVPSRTVMLNQDRAGNADYLYLLWGWSDGKSEVGIDESELLFGWYTDTDRLEVLAYSGSEEIGALVSAAKSAIDESRPWEFALMRAASFDVREGMIARFSLEPSDEGE